MAALGSLEHIFEKPLPENPTLLESLSPCKRWIRPVDDSPSATEFFGELHFKEPTNHVVDPSPSPSPSSSCSSLSSIASTLSTQPVTDTPTREIDKCSDTSSYCQNRDSLSSDGLSLCTEGLGSESVDEVEYLLTSEEACNDKERMHQEKRKKSCTRNHSDFYNSPEEIHRLCNESTISRTSRSSGGFPPPLSSIGISGKPWVCLKSFREDGRFILKEMRIPTHEFLHACRENGRLTMQFIHSDDDDEVLEGDEDGDSRKGVEIDAEKSKRNGFT